MPRLVKQGQIKLATETACHGQPKICSIQRVSYFNISKHSLQLSLQYFQRMRKASSRADIEAISRKAIDKAQADERRMFAKLIVNAASPECSSGIN